MSWGIDFSADIFIKAVSADNIYQVEDQIEECLNSINESKTILNMIAMANPKDIADNEEDVVYSIKNRVNELVESIQDEYLKWYKLTLYKDVLIEQSNPSK